MLTTRYATRGRVRRAFVPHAHGALHVRWAGAGAPLLAMHESPRSSLSLLPLIDGLADRRTVVAFDTPGYGHSDPLQLDVPEGADFARAFLQAFDALGVSRASIYATHTGAALAIFAALAQPSRVAALVLDGFAAFDAAEREDFVGRYLAPFEPTWDGAHIAHLWSRCRDLFLWFPYHQRFAAKRLALDPPGPDKVHETVLGFLMAGAGYAKGYRCAGTLEPDAAIAALRVPTTITARPHDLIHSHLDRVTPTEFVRVHRIGPTVDEWLATVERAAPAVGAAPDLARATRARTRDDWDRVLVELGDGYLHALDRGAGEVADVVLPDIPDAALRVAATLPPSSRRTIVIDPPGCGASDPARSDARPRDEVAAEALRAALDALGVKRCRLLGEGFGAVLAARVAAQDARVVSTTCVGLPAWARGAAPVPPHAVVPAPTRDTDGAALFTSWYRIRERFLYDDAGAACPRARTARAEAPPADDVHARYAALWVAPESAALAADIQARVRAEPEWYRRATLADGDCATALPRLADAPRSA
jgi:pimeloyl-ACP methyl ester carboxylesterase